MSQQFVTCKTNLSFTICIMIAHNVMNRFTLCTNKLNESWHKNNNRKHPTDFEQIILNKIHKGRGHHFIKVDRAKSLWIEQKRKIRTNTNKIRAAWLWRQENTEESLTALFTASFFIQIKYEEKRKKKTPHRLVLCQVTHQDRLFVTHLSQLTELIWVRMGLLFFTKIAIFTPLSKHIFSLARKTGLKVEERKLYLWGKNVLAEEKEVKEVIFVKIHIF